MYVLRSNGSDIKANEQFDSQMVHVKVIVRYINEDAWKLDHIMRCIFILQVADF